MSRTNNSLILNRNSSIELLRILCMFGIVFMHTFSFVYMKNEYLLISLIENGIFNCGVTIFVLISGYYGIKLRFEKLFRFEFIALFANLILIILHLYHKLFDVMSLSDKVRLIISCLFPFSSGKNKFYCGFVLLSLLSPFINYFAVKINKHFFRILLFILIVYFYLFPILFFNNYNNDYGKGFLHYFIVYLIGRYISIYYVDFQVHKVRSLVFIIIFSFIFAFALNYAVSIIFKRNYILFSIDNSLFILIQSISIFLLLIKMLFYNNIINYISTFNFAVFFYNSILISYLYNDFIIKFINTHVLYINVIFLIFMVFIVYISCVFFEIFRKLLFQNIENSVVDFVIIKISKTSFYKLINSYFQSMLSYSQ